LERVPPLEIVSVAKSTYRFRVNGSTITGFWLLHNLGLP
jgi:hypothetical protein